MPKLASASRRGHKFLEFFKAHHEDKLECRSSGRFGTQTEHGTHRYHELLNDVNKALDDLLGLHGSDDGDEVIEIPKCMYERALCDRHRQICLSFVGRCDSEASENHRTKSVAPKMNPDLPFAGTESESDREDGYGELFNSHECTDEMDQQSADDTNTDLNDASYNDSDNNSSRDSFDNDDDDDELLSSDDTCDLAEYDKEEVIQKDQVSQRRRQLIEDDEDDLRTLVTVSGNDVRSQSIFDQMQSQSIKQASRMTSNLTGGHSSSAPSTPKKDTPSLQHSYDSDSARRISYGVHYKNSPGPRTLMTVTTISADPSYDKDVRVNEEAVRRRISALFASKGHNSAYGEVGFVYAFRDNELPFIKIGHATDLKKRKAQIEKACGFVKSMSLVAAVKVKAYKRLEEIIHQDLAPHRRFFDCACGESRNRNGFTRHQEYFEIDDDTASSTLQLWADFVERQPWEPNQLRQQATNSKPDWHDKMLELSRVEPSETHESHEKRVQRWREFFGIPAPVAKIEKGTSISPFILRSTAKSFNDDAIVTESSIPDYTPSKPPRPAAEDMAEADTSEDAEHSLSKSLELESLSSELTDLTSEKDRLSKTHNRMFDLPDRTKGGEPILNGPPASTASSMTAETASNRQSVAAAGKQPSLIFPNTCETRLNTSVRPENIRDKIPSAVNGLPSGVKVADAPISQNTSVDPGPWAHIQFTPFGKQPDEGPASPAISNSTINNERTDNLVDSAVKIGPTKAHQTHDKAQSIGQEHLQPQKAQTPVTVMSASTIAQSMTELANCLLAKEVRPLPAKAISADIWHFRWPLACSIAFALHSPHIPAGLSFLMWSIFLPFFVAELRGWNVADHPCT